MGFIRNVAGAYNDNKSNLIEGMDFCNSAALSFVVIKASMECNLVIAVKNFNYFICTLYQLVTVRKSKKKIL